MDVRIITAGLAVALLTGCGGSSDGDDAAADPVVQVSSEPTPAPSTAGPCTSITVGAKVDVTLLESGCYDPDRNTTYTLAHTKCRSGTDFGTFDLKDAGGTKDQLFAYQGTWHSTNAEGALYKKAFDECL